MKTELDNDRIPKHLGIKLASFNRNFEEGTSIEVEGRLTDEGYLVFTKKHIPLHRRSYSSV